MSNTMKKALITGITGQDGSFLAELLLEKGYAVHGIIRRSSVSTTERIDHLIAQNAISVHDGDLSDSSSLIRIINEVRPDEIYNLAAQSHVGVLLMHQNTREILMRWECYEFLKRFESWAWQRHVVFIRHLLPSFLARWKNAHKTNVHLFILTVHMR